MSDAPALDEAERSPVHQTTSPDSERSDAHGPSIWKRRRRPPFLVPRIRFRTDLAAGLAAWALIVPKMFEGITLCTSDGRWDLVNALMVLYEFVGGLLLLGGVRETRRVTALSLTAIMASVALFSVGAGAFDVDLSDCGCFGPIDLPWYGHALVALGFGAVFGWAWLDLERAAGEHADAAA